jgi:hypothetical protein
VCSSPNTSLPCGDAGLKPPALYPFVTAKYAIVSGCTRNATETCGDTFEYDFDAWVAGSCWKKGSTKNVPSVPSRFS